MCKFHGIKFNLHNDNPIHQVSMILRSMWSQPWSSKVKRRGRRGRDRIVDGFTTTCAISASHHYICEFESRCWRGVLNTKLYVSDLRQGDGFLRILWFPPPINWQPRYKCNMAESGVKHHNHNQSKKNIYALGKL